MPLSKKALEHKREYNRRRNKELTKLFSVRLPIQEYDDLCERIKAQNMNKADFMRWAIDKFKED